jgi:predicted ATPase
LSSKFFLITGCSGGGKSTLLNELARRGYATTPEPGRRIVAEETAGSGQALPWINLPAFAHRAVDMAQADLVKAHAQQGFVFFDRGLVDAAAALQFASGIPYRETLGPDLHYAKTVFLAPPWPDIYVQDTGRQHDFKSAAEEFSRLKAALIGLGYDLCLLPKTTVKERADFVLKHL